MRRFPFALSLLALGLFACASPPDAPAEAEGTLPAALATWLYGSDTQCETNSDCLTETCSLGGRCEGLVNTRPPWVTQHIGQLFLNALETQPEWRTQATASVMIILQQPEFSLHDKIGAIRALSLIAHGDAVLTDVLRDTLATLLDDEDPALADQAAIHLTGLGLSDGLSRTAALTEARDLSLAIDALKALGHAPIDDPRPLETLLPFLSPTLELERQRAAIFALTQLKDPRATRPLVAFLDQAPDSLRQDIIAALQALTGTESTGRPPADWQPYADSAPAPPNYQRHSHDSMDDILIPTP